MLQTPSETGTAWPMSAATATSDPEGPRDRLLVVPRLAEQTLRRLAAFEVEVDVVIPREAGAAVHLHRDCGRVHECVIGPNARDAGDEVTMRVGCIREACGMPHCCTRGFHLDED